MHLQATHFGFEAARQYLNRLPSRQRTTSKRSRYNCPLPRQRENPVNRQREIGVIYGRFGLAKLPFKRVLQLVYALAGLRRNP